MYRFTLSLNSALDGVSGQLHPAAALSPGMSLYPLWIPGPVWTGAGNRLPPPTGIRSADRPAHRESLYRMSYRSPVRLIKD